MFKLPDELKKNAREIVNAYLQAAVESGYTAADVGALPPETGQAFVFSDFITRNCCRHPDLLMDLYKSGDLATPYGPDGCAQRLADFLRQQAGQDTQVLAKTGLQRALRLFRRREMVRIALRDICGWADLNETLGDLSTLADACLEAAIGQLHRTLADGWGTPKDKNGLPLQLVVLALGKLGARELNFSSDVDLMFAYQHEGQTSGGARGSLSHQDFFLKLARELIQVIGAATADGFVFRVDARLRPFGEAGPLVMTFDKLEDYYHEQGREWERYALIKARVAAGDRVAGEQLLERLRPFIFRRYLDYGAFDSLRDMKARIAMEVRNKRLEDNIKVGSGGIREIEFFGQMFQLIRGGVEQALQVRPIRKVLKVLEQKRYIPAKVALSLDSAYVFLRTVENRLQQWADQQTHQLPVEPAARFRLAAAMGFDTWERFYETLQQHRSQVHRHFDDLLSQKKMAANHAAPKKWGCCRETARWLVAGLDR